MSEIKKFFTKLKWEKLVTAIVAIVLGIVFVADPNGSGDAVCKVAGVAMIVLAAAMLWLSGCVETDADKRENAPTHEIAKADQYAIDVLETYYLWNEEIEKDLARLDPDTCRMPMEVVKGIRYHEGGKEVDRWTVLTDDLKSFQNSVQGLGITYGYDLQAGRISLW